MNRITEYVDSFIPKNLPKKRKAALKEELQNHILDKTDSYTDMGFSEEQSIEKAINDFGTDREMKKYIFAEFEALYAEKTIWGIISFIFILIMNLSCYRLDTWVTSADFNRDPYPVGAFISFMMILAVIVLIIFAKIKEYRKMFIGIGLANLAVGGIYLWNFYPQMAAYTVGFNLFYLIDCFTPIYLGDMADYGLDGIIISVLWLGFPFVIALYSFTEAVRIKKGRAKKVRRSIRTIVLIIVLYIGFAFLSAGILPASVDYFDEYPVWFEEYNFKISEESENLYGKISIGDSVSDIDAYLHSEGYRTTEEYRNSLDRLEKKQFDGNMRHFDLIDGYTIWFNPEKHINGNGLIAIKAENGTVTGVGIGNLNKEVYYGATYESKNFGISGGQDSDDMQEVLNCFNSLNKGDSITDIMSRFGKEFGEIYTERQFLENDTVKHYYRIYCRGDTISNDYWEFDYYYIELLFTDCKLEKGTLYSKIYKENDTSVDIYRVK